MYVGCAQLLSLISDLVIELWFSVVQSVFSLSPVCVCLCVCVSVCVCVCLHKLGQQVLYTGSYSIILTVLCGIHMYNIVWDNWLAGKYMEGCDGDVSNL